MARTYRYGAVREYIRQNPGCDSGDLRIGLGIGVYPQKELVKLREVNQIVRCRGGTGPYRYWVTDDV